MTLKEWLSRGRGIDNEIKMLEQECERTLSEATRVSAPMGGERVQTSQRNTSEDKMIEYVDYVMTIAKRRAELITVKNEIFAVISKVEDRSLRMLLTGRYIGCETWEQVAEDINKSYVHTVHRLHPKALAAVEEILKGV